MYRSVAEPGYRVKLSIIADIDRCRFNNCVGDDDSEKGSGLKGRNPQHRPALPRASRLSTTNLRTDRSKHNSPAKFRGSSHVHVPHGSKIVAVVVNSVGDKPSLHAYTRTNTHAHAHAQTHTHARTHTRTHKHTHKHTPEHLRVGAWPEVLRHGVEDERGHVTMYVRATRIGR